MLEKIISIYSIVFAQIYFEKFNKLLFRCSISGLGLLNYRNSNISGERSFLRNYLPGKSGVIIDVGANEGKYSEDILSMNQDVHIYAFEPHPITFKRLVEKLQSNQFMTLINQGLSEAEGFLELYDYASKDGSSHASLYADVITDIHGVHEATSHQVSLTTLDAFIEKNQIETVELLKIDTEGNELAILRGAAECIKKRKILAIHFEFNEMNVVSRSFFRDFWQILDGYKFYRLLPNTLLEIKEYNPLYCELFGFQNIVAILKEKTDD